MKIRIVCEACAGKCCTWSPDSGLQHCGQCGGSGGTTHEVGGVTAATIRRLLGGKPERNDHEGDEP